MLGRTTGVMKWITKEFSWLITTAYADLACRWCILHSFSEWLMQQSEMYTSSWGAWNQVSLHSSLRYTKTKSKLMLITIFSFQFHSRTLTYCFKLIKKRYKYGQTALYGKKSRDVGWRLHSWKAVKTCTIIVVWSHKEKLFLLCKAFINFKCKHPPPPFFCLKF